MKIKLLKPLYLDAKVVLDGEIIDFHDWYSKKLIAKGYAELVEDSNTSNSDSDSDVSLSDDDLTTTEKQSKGKKGKKGDS